MSIINTNRENGFKFYYFLERVVNMPDSNKKSRSETNFEKRDAFYNKLKTISFDFDTRTLDFKTFKEKFSKQLGVLARICSYTRNNCKGYLTRKHLKLVSDKAHSCNEIIEKPIEEYERDRGERAPFPKRLHLTSSYVPVEELYALSDVLVKTSNAHFPYLINRSTLDYKFTRDKLHELGTQIPYCIDEMLALYNECEINNLLRRINYINRDNENKAHHLWYKKDYCYLAYQSNRKLQWDEFNHHWVDLRVINRISKRLRSFNKIKDFSNQLKALNDISDILSLDSAYWANYVCDDCGKAFMYRRDSENHYDVDVGCGHILCLDCLKRMVAKNRYKCPLCMRTLSRKWVLERIEDGE